LRHNDTILQKNFIEGLGILDKQMKREKGEDVVGGEGDISQPQQLLGYWAAHEQYSMQDLLKFVVEAERGGFTTTMTSDHFHPWWHDNAFGNFTWIWIATAAERTKKMHFTTGVTAPVYRYHPAIIAQAFASFDALHPGRISLGLGTGEAMNETPLGFDWPSPKVRLARTKEAIDIIKSLWRQEGKNNEDGLSHTMDLTTTYTMQNYTLLLQVITYQYIWQLLVVNLQGLQHNIQTDSSHT
jgi:G6PDH family F420-dependent oxidoreductase